MLLLVEIVLLGIALVACAAIVASYSKYMREGGKPFRPWFVEQSTSRESELARRSKKAAMIALVALIVLSLVDIATKP